MLDMSFHILIKNHSITVYFGHIVDSKNICLQPGTMIQCVLEIIPGKRVPQVNLIFSPHFKEIKNTKFSLKNRVSISQKKKNGTKILNFLLLVSSFSFKISPFLNFQFEKSLPNENIVRDLRSAILSRKEEYDNMKPRPVFVAWGR